MIAAIGPGQPRELINKRRVAASLLGLPIYFALFMFLPAGNWAWLLEAGLACKKSTPSEFALEWLQACGDRQ